MNNTAGERLSDERMWLVTAGPDGEVSQVVVGFDAMKNAVARCVWDGSGDSEPADVLQMREELDDPDFWSGDFWSCAWDFEDGYLRVQRVTDVSQALRCNPVGAREEAGEWVLVPMRSTEAMRRAWRSYQHYPCFRDSVSSNEEEEFLGRYAAMIEAALAEWKAKS
jgi:hypothetical protein